jgi:hypothetical protein
MLKMKRKGLPADNTRDESGGKVCAAISFLVWL